MLENAELVTRCTERVTGLCERRSAIWDPSWSRPENQLGGGKHDGQDILMESTN